MVLYIIYDIIYIDIYNIITGTVIQYLGSIDEDC